MVLCSNEWYCGVLAVMSNIVWYCVVMSSIMWYCVIMCGNVPLFCLV